MVRRCNEISGCCALVSTKSDVTSQYFDLFLYSFHSIEHRPSALRHALSFIDERVCFKNQVTDFPVVGSCLAENFAWVGQFIQTWSSVSIILIGRETSPDLVA